MTGAGTRAAELDKTDDRKRRQRQAAVVAVDFGDSRSCLMSVFGQVRLPVWDELDCDKMCHKDTCCFVL